MSFQNGSYIFAPGIIFPGRDEKLYFVISRIWPKAFPENLGILFRFSWKNTTSVYSKPKTVMSGISVEMPFSVLVTFRESIRNVVLFLSWKSRYFLCPIYRTRKREGILFFYRIEKWSPRTSRVLFFTAYIDPWKYFIL